MLNLTNVLVAVFSLVLAGVRISEGRRWVGGLLIVVGCLNLGAAFYSQYEAYERRIWAIIRREK